LKDCESETSSDGKEQGYQRIYFDVGRSGGGSDVCFTAAAAVISEVASDRLTNICVEYK
jgi:hypothetical protein